MAYDAIQPAAFVPNPNAEPLSVNLHTLSFPAPWRGPVLDLYKHGKTSSGQAKIRQVPIKRLNTAIRTVAPDLLAVEANASFDEEKPWLYSDADFPVPPLTSLVHAWLRDMQPSPELYPLFRQTAEQLNLRAFLTWA